MSLDAGTRLGPYEILAPIGAGGMGQVYKARDTRLDRTVAIKISTERFSDRFEQEARAVAALNHPHVCQLYDVGPDYLVMEYVEGKALRGPLPLADVLRLGAQIAAALDAAHRKGIAHRDLKPGNILVTKAGIKLLDFGLARMNASRARPAGDLDATQAMTQQGTITGTLQYIAPEQLEGKEAGPAGDLFSFGCVLREMVTGKPAFEAASPAALIAAILHNQPPPVSPPALQRLIAACLEKDPEARWQSAADLRRELEWLAAAQQAPVARASRRRLVWLALVPAALLLGFAAARWSPAARVTMSDAVPLTSYPGIESNPVLSPDGKLIAFAWTGPKFGSPQIYVKQLDGSEPLALTHDDEPHGSIAWSPDGRQIAFVRYLPDARDTALAIVPALGGPERQVSRAGMLGRTSGGTCWLPAANTIVVGGWAMRPDPGLVAVSLERGEQKVLTQPPQGFVDIQPSLSPDGRSLAFVRYTGLAGARNSLHILKLDRDQRLAGEPQLIPAEVQEVGGIAWAPDGRSLLVSVLRKGTHRLARVSVPGGATEPFAGAPAGVMELSVCAPARRLAMTVEQHDIDIWRVAGPAWPASEPEPQPERLIASSYDEVSPDWSADGKRIVFESGRTGNQEIWAVDADGRNAVQLTNFGGPSVGTPRWSPDGSKVAFDSRKFGHTDIFVVGAGGGAPVRLTTDDSDHTRPTWSSDGRWIFFGSDRAGGEGLWKIPSEGGAATQVTHDGGRDSHRLAGDTWIYYSTPDAYVCRIRESGGTPEKLLRAPWSRWIQSRDGILTYFLSGWTLDLLHFKDGRHSVLRKLPEAASSRFLRTGNLTISPDGRWALVPLLTLDRGDLMMMENVR